MTGYTNSNWGDYIFPLRFEYVSLVLNMITLWNLRSAPVAIRNSQHLSIWSLQIWIGRELQASTHDIIIRRESALFSFLQTLQLIFSALISCSHNENAWQAWWFCTLYLLKRKSIQIHFKVTTIHWKEKETKHPHARWEDDITPACPCHLKLRMQ